MANKETKFEFKFLYSFLSYFVSFSVLTLSLIYVVWGMDGYKIAYSDFPAFFAGAKMLLTGHGREIYDVAGQYTYFRKVLGIEGEHYIIFRALPSSAFPYMPFTLLSLENAYKVFAVLNSLLAIMAGEILLRVTGTKNKLLLRPLFYLFWPVLLTVIIGQTSVIVLFVVLAAIANMKRRPMMSGFLTSLILGKLQFIFLVPMLFIASDRKKEYLKGFLTGLITLGIIYLSFISPQGLLKYPAFLVLTEAQKFNSWPGWYPTFATLLSFTGISQTLIYFWNLVFYLIVLILYKRSVKGGNLIPSAILMTVFFGIHIGIYELSILIIPIYFLCGSFLRTKKISFLAVAALLYISPLMMYLNYSALAALIFFCSALWLMRSK